MGQYNNYHLQWDVGETLGMYMNCFPRPWGSWTQVFPERTSKNFFAWTILSSSEDYGNRSGRDRNGHQVIDFKGSGAGQINVHTTEHLWITLRTLRNHQTVWQRRNVFLNGSMNVKGPLFSSMRNSVYDPSQLFLIQERSSH